MFSVKNNFIQKLINRLLLVFCLIIGVLGNSSFVECIELNNEEISSHIQLFRCPTGTAHSSSESFPSVIDKQTSNGDEQCPFCLDVQLNFNSESIYSLDDSFTCQGLFPRASAAHQSIDFSSPANHLFIKEHFLDAPPQDKSIRTLRTVYLLI